MSVEELEKDTLKYILENVNTFLQDTWIHLPPGGAIWHFKNILTSVQLFPFVICTYYPCISIRLCDEQYPKNLLPRIIFSCEN